MQSVTELPFNRLIGLQTADEPALLRLPEDVRYTNHLGAVHASAQLALAEAASGEFLLRQLGGAEGVIPVVRRLEAKFHKPAQGAVTATAQADGDAMERLKSELAAKGRAVVSVAVEVRDAADVRTLSATVEWFIARRS